MTRRALWISAADAAALLGVSRATLYAYVSRGFVRSQPGSAGSRQRRYARDDVERLRRRSEEQRQPAKAAARALEWGLPVLESSITLIDGDRLYYRGHDALVLARTRSFDEVASLIWTGGFDVPAWTPAAAGERGDADLPFTARAQSALARAAWRDPAAFDLRPASVAACGRRVVDLLAAAAAPRARLNGRLTVDQRLARAWRVPVPGADILRAALILCADHELNASSFAARCVASTGADPYAVVLAALSALGGPKHGGAADRLDATVRELRSERDLRLAIAARFRRGERVDGFGHPLYRGGDPRAASLLALLREHFPGSAALRVMDAVERAVADVTRERPNLDFALAAVGRVLALPAGTPLALFAIGRAIGWIGHAMEQYAADQLIRPRAKYVGVAPVAR